MQRASVLLTLLFLGFSALFARPAAAAVVLSSFEGTPDQITGEVRLVWKTASQLDTAGFNLYRSDRAEGPYVRINPQLVPATPQAVTGNTYEYVDRNVNSGRTYYYQLEELEINGKSTRFPPATVPVPAALGPGPLLLAAGGAVALLAVGGFLFLRRRTRPGA